jgi:hypothetical protein
VINETSWKTSEIVGTMVAHISMCHHLYRHVGLHAIVGEGRKQEDLERFLLLLFLMSAMSLTITCKRNKTQQALDFIVFYLDLFKLSISIFHFVCLHQSELLLVAKRKG